MTYDETIELCKTEPFSITIKNGQKLYSMRVEQVYLSPKIEHFKISAGGKEILLLSDRPWLKYSVSKNQGIHWKLISKEAKVYNNPEAFEAILRQLEDHIKHLHHIKQQKKE